MKWPRVAVDASMFAATVRVDAGFKSNIRAVVMGDNGPAMVFEELRVRKRVLLRIPVDIAFEDDLLEPVRRIVCSATRRNCWPVIHTCTLIYLTTDGHGWTRMKQRTKDVRVK